MQEYLILLSDERVVVVEAEIFVVVDEFDEFWFGMGRKAWSSPSSARCYNYISTPLTLGSHVVLFCYL